MEFLELKFDIPYSAYSFLIFLDGGLFEGGGLIRGGGGLIESMLALRKVIKRPRLF